MARPSKLTPEVEEKILNAVGTGSSFAGAAGYAGIDASTFHRWMQRGDPDAKERADAPFRTFRRKVEQARDEAEVRDITLIAKAGKTDWRAAAWRLERRMPERYGRAATTEVLPKAPEDDSWRSIGYMTGEELDQMRSLYDTAKERMKKGERPPRKSRFKRLHGVS